METKPLKFTNITADRVKDADTDADVMETQLYRRILILIILSEDILPMQKKN